MKLNNKIRLAITPINFLMWALLMRFVTTYSVKRESPDMAVLSFVIIWISFMFFTKLTEYMWSGVNSFFALKEEEGNYIYAHRFSFSVLIILDFLYSVINHVVEHTWFSFGSLLFGLAFFAFGLYEAKNIYLARKEYLQDSVNKNK